MVNSESHSKDSTDLKGVENYQVLVIMIPGDVRFRSGYNANGKGTNEEDEENEQYQLSGSGCDEFSEPSEK